MEDIYEGFSKIAATAVSDVTGGRGNMDEGIKPLAAGMVLCGPAYPVKVTDNDNIIVLKSLSLAPAGSILVIDAGGECRHARMGDFMAGMAKLLGIAGAVIDGAVRDSSGIRNSGFPVFCRQTTLASSCNVGSAKGVDAVVCGGVVISQGDIILGNDDGVTVIPKNEAANIFSAADNKEKKDDARSREVLQDAKTVRAYLAKVLAQYK